MKPKRNKSKALTLLGPASCSAFVRDYREARYIWGLRDSWLRDAEGMSKANRAWNALLWSAALAETHADEWTSRDQLVLEGAAVEFEHLSRLSLRMQNDQAEPLPPDGERGRH